MSRPPKGSRAWLRKTRNRKGALRWQLHVVLKRARSSVALPVRTFRDVTKAREALAAALVRVTAGTPEAPSTWAEACDLYAARCVAQQHRPRSVELVRARLAAVTATLADFAPGVDPLELEEQDGTTHVLRRQGAGLSPRTIAQEVRTVVAMQRWMRAQGWLTDVTWARVALPSGERGKALLNPDEAGLWLATAARLGRTAPGYERWEAAAWLLLHGLRTGELVHLQLGDVDLGGAVVWVRDRVGARTKSRASVRGVPLMTQEAVEALRDAVGTVEGRWTQPLFPGRDGGPLYDRTSWFRERAHRTCVEAGLRPVVPHGMRHSTVTGAGQLGVGLGQVGRFVGHADPSVTARVYDHTAATEMRRAMAPWGQALTAAYHAARRSG